MGDIDDRTDLPKPDDIEKTGEHIWKIQGGAILDDVAEVINVELPVEKYDTFSVSTRSCRVTIPTKQPYSSSTTAK